MEAVHTLLPATPRRFRPNQAPAFYCESLVSSLPDYTIRRPRELSASCAQNALLIFNLQIICHRKYAGNTLGLHFGNLFIHLPGHNPNQGHVAMVHDDMDRGHRT